LYIRVNVGKNKVGELSDSLNLRYSDCQSERTTFYVLIIRPKSKNNYYWLV